jgi:uncharacterized membrane protein
MPPARHTLPLWLPHRFVLAAGAGARTLAAQPTQGGRAMTGDAFSPENVVVVSFADDNKAYEGLTTLKELDTQGQLRVEEVAVVTRADDGRIDVKEQVGDPSLFGTGYGGVVGLLIGILGGPLGVLLGGATGVLVGSLFDLADAEDSDSVLSAVSKSVQVGRTALLAQVTEQSPEVIDTAMASLSGTVVRRSVSDVESEIAAAQQAQFEAKKEARKQLVKARHEKTRDEVHAKVDELKSKLHGDRKPAATRS